MLTDMSLGHGQRSGVVSLRFSLLETWTQGLPPFLPDIIYSVGKVTQNRISTVLLFLKAAQEKVPKKKVG